MAHGEALRIRVIKAVVEDGLSRNEAARIFRVGDHERDPLGEGVR
jgi:transposase